ncbi:MAG: hypothetical protein AAFZ63_08550 [Bacteroidota bacterium]
MHYFEEEYQRRFKDAESSEGINPDQLWEGIAQELEPEPARRFPFWWLLIPFLLLIVSGVAYWSWSGSVDTASESFNTTAIEAQASVQETPKTNTSLSATPTTEARNQTSPSPSPESPSVVSTTVIEQQDQSEMPYLTSPQEVTLANGTEAIEQAPKSIPARTAREEGRVATVVPTKVDEEPRTAVIRLTTVTENITSLSFAPVFDSGELELPAVHSTNTPLVKAARKPIEVELVAGTVQWHDRFSDASDANVGGSTLNDANRALGGYQFAFRLRKQLRENWSASTGFQFSQVYNTFDWTRNWDTLMYRDNVPGSDLINATAERRVKHQNELRWVQVPILLSYESAGESWRFGLETGIGLNYLLSQSGRTLQSEATVLTFDDVEEGPYNRFFLSTQVLPFIGYQLNEQALVRLQGGLHYQWHGRSAVYQLRHQSILTTLSIVATMQL